MDYDQTINEMVGSLQSDKTLMQPYKNYAVSDARRLQAVIRMAKTTTNIKPPEDMPAPAGRFPSPRPETCTCPPLAIDPKCPVHSGQQ